MTPLFNPVSRVEKLRPRVGRDLSKVSVQVSGGTETKTRVRDILCDSIFMRYPDMGNLWGQKADEWPPGAGAATASWVWRFLGAMKIIWD